ncbi:MAG: NfeD family protein [Ruminococcus sp.]|nr:NfeD family protein [Ruminococcus sp.]
MNVEQFMPFIWLGIAVILAIVEVSTTQLVSIWFVVGAVASAISTSFTDNLMIQIIVFVLVSAICLIATRPFVKNVTKNKKISTNADSLIEKTGIITIEVNNTLSQGQINVDGQIWTARSKNNKQILSVKEKARVKEISGVKLIVEPVENFEEE